MHPVHCTVRSTALGEIRLYLAYYTLLWTLFNTRIWKLFLWVLSIIESKTRSKPFKTKCRKLLRFGLKIYFRCFFKLYKSCCIWWFYVLFPGKEIFQIICQSFVILKFFLKGPSHQIRFAWKWGVASVNTSRHLIKKRIGKCLEWVA
jgi:hypothetical protein